MKAQTIGTEIEFTGLTRQAAAETVAKFFGTTAIYTGGTYDAWAAKDGTGRDWKVMSDSSIRAEKKSGGEVQSASGQYRCELVTPILGWADIETLQEVVRKLRKAGAFVNETCGQHVHIGAAGMTAAAIRNLVNNFASHEKLLIKALNVHESRETYCEPLSKNFLERLNKKKPATLEELGRIWYNTSGEFPTNHYHESRYQTLNLHALFTKGTIEFRLFNATTHAGEVKTAIQLCCALVANAKKATRTLYKPIETDNAKFAMRTWLTRPGNGLNLNGEEFATLRLHLTKRLEGNAAWRHAV
ncbi:MAG: amidoligase family protein [Clostridia bacterium]|nr:amidoligase family protein [Clostridia bacterium]